MIYPGQVPRARCFRIPVGEKIPDVTLKATDMKDVTTQEIFGGKKVVIFAVPGAFTPTCSKQHLPGFVAKAGDIKARGVDSIVCVSTSRSTRAGAS